MSQLEMEITVPKSLADVAFEDGFDEYDYKVLERQINTLVKLLREAGYISLHDDISEIHFVEDAKLPVDYNKRKIVVGGKVATLNITVSNDN